MNLLFYFVWLLLIFAFGSHSAHAYLDPGSGSFLFQIIIGGILSAMFAIKLYFRKIKNFFSKKNIQKDNNEKPKENS